MVLTIDPAILPAPTGAVVLPIPTVSNHYARPVLVDGQPYADIGPSHRGSPTTGKARTTNGATCGSSSPATTAHGSAA
jgi:hypothetical protein